MHDGSMLFSGEGSVSVTAQSNTKGQSLLFFDESPSSWPTVRSPFPSSRLQLSPQAANVLCPLQVLATYYELSCGALRNLSMLIMIDEENDAKTEVPYPTTKSAARPHRKHCIIEASHRHLPPNHRALPNISTSARMS